MNEQKKVVAKKQKLTLNRETLRKIADNELQVLDGVVGGTNTYKVCESYEFCNTTTC